MRPQNPTASELSLTDSYDLQPVRHPRRSDRNPSSRRPYFARAARGDRRESARSHGRRTAGTAGWRGGQRKSAGADPSHRHGSAHLPGDHGGRRWLAEQNLPISGREATVPEAIAFFESRNDLDKVRLMRHRRKPTVILYRLGECVDYHHGFMVPSTGYLRWFELVAMDGGFALRYPRQHTPTKLEPMVETPKLLATFRQYGAWLQRLGISSVGALDDAIKAGRSREIILVSEALHEQHIAEIARQIADRRQQARLVLIAGPSSSGKTTFSRRLAVQLLALGLSPFALELDNYFAGREHTSRDANGHLDYESTEALRLAQLGDHLERLLAGEEVQLPRYSFAEGRQEPGDVVRLRPEQLIILEGIHGLNPVSYT